MRVCNKCVPVLGGNGTKIAPTGDIFNQPLGQMRLVRGKLADHVGDHVVLSPEGAVLVTSPGTKSSYPRPPQSLNPSIYMVRVDFVLATIYRVSYTIRYNYLSAACAVGDNSQPNRVAVSW